MLNKVLVQTYFSSFKDVLFNYEGRAAAHTNAANKLYIGGSPFSTSTFDKHIKLEKSNVHNYIEYRSEVRRRKQNLRRVR